MEGEEVKCDRCNENEPGITCPECNSLLCQFCYDTHKRNKRFRGDDIVPLTELRSNKDRIAGG